MPPLAWKVSRLMGIVENGFKITEKLTAATSQCPHCSDTYLVPYKSALGSERLEIALVLTRTVNSGLLLSGIWRGVTKD